MSKKITWKLIEVNTRDLKINPKNPKSENAVGFDRLRKSLEKFGKVFDGIVNKDMSIIDGHARLRLSEVSEGSKATVFIPSRQLTESEYKEMNAVFDLSRAGEPDVVFMKEIFGDEFFNEWDIDNAKHEINEVEIRPFKKTHVLLSFPPERMEQLERYLTEITKFPDVEYEQASN